ncbi:hypothetical protein EUTSA_v10012030mg [Eutrema salsugineum]|uniref:Transmembrane protein n=1 Tax=Eutrema salsugineum TaxID=72664 RepID=V4KSD5_EUTSA|nr:uncharacterized protein LOC18010395 [Eutrema salsugineum]ESQ30268.1 hypothetical protein EUTSA_v10012030mg [Eutrema salsugineum]
MVTERSNSIILFSILVLVLVFSPILPCQAARVQFDAEGRMLLKERAPGRYCPACVCCAPAPKDGCCPCICR